MPAPSARSPRVRWKADAEEHQYHAAYRFVTLHYGRDRAEQYEVRWRRGEVVEYPAKDLIRAATVALLPSENPYVARHLEKWMQTRPHPVGPALLVRDRPLIIADGYHRICAAYWVDENTLVACKIA